MSDFSHYRKGTPKKRCGTCKFSRVGEWPWGAGTTTCYIATGVGNGRECRVGKNMICDSFEPKSKKAFAEAYQGT